MKIQIVYVSKTGNTAKLAKALAADLPVECELVDFSKQHPTLEADAYLVGFGVQRNACPFSILEWLETLNDKQIFLFATCGLAGMQEYQRKLESLIIPFLPDNCIYHGLSLSQGSISKEGYDYFLSCMLNPKDKQSIQRLDQLYRHSQGHPSQQDIDVISTSIRQKLSL